METRKDQKAIELAQGFKKDNPEHLRLDGLYISKTASVELAEALRGRGDNHFQYLSMMGCTFEDEYCVIRILQAVVNKKPEDVTFLNLNENFLNQLKKNSHALGQMAACKMQLPMLDTDKALKLLLDDYQKKLPPESKFSPRKVISRPTSPEKKVPPRVKAQEEREIKTAAKLKDAMQRVENKEKEKEEQRIAAAKALKDKHEAAKQKRRTLEKPLSALVANSAIGRKRKGSPGGPCLQVCKL